ncbi:MAG: winged helix-turn-helix domain-containing protein [Acidobacteria bacterium]|nr:winged helix-turn-helix domain-containing protein [Acidobacteriota bacterium]
MKTDPDSSFPSPGAASESYRFGAFELTTQPLQLLCEGQPLELAPQPARLLELLVSRAGELVSREEIRQALWGDDTHVDFERGINFSIRKIRSTLGDDPALPRFIETIPRHGYRFVASVADGVSESGEAPEPRAVPLQSQRRPRVALVVALALSAVIAGLWWNRTPSSTEGGRPDVSGDEASSLPPELAEAYRVGRRLLESEEQVDWQEAQEAFDKVIQGQADFAPAYAGKAVAAHYLQDVPTAASSSQAALELDPDQADALMVAAKVALDSSLDLALPKAHLEHLLSLDPNSASALELLYVIRVAEGLTGEAVEVSRRLLDLDPVSWRGRWALGWCLFQDRRYEESIEQVQSAKKLFPKRPANPFQLLIHAYLRVGRQEEALQEANEFVLLEEPKAAPFTSLEQWWRWSLARVPPLRDPPSQQRSQWAILHLGLGETEEALALLRDACEKRSTWDLLLLPVDPRFDPLRIHPEFQEILRCMREQDPSQEGALPASEEGR